jgi:osmotically-inducible protein OsmY
VSRISRVAVAVSGAIAAVAASVFVPLAVRRSRQDQVTPRVRLALEAAYDGAEALTVRSERGMVSLRGEVSDLDDIERLEAVVRAVPGVRDVDNLLRLQLTGVAARPRVLTA